MARELLPDALWERVKDLLPAHPPQPKGGHRWVVERTLAWLKSFRRLTIRYEVRDDIHFAFLQLACCLILVRQLR